MKKRFRRSHRQPPELDITAFLNLMVILIPFLLITAVFSQTNILEMNLPAQTDDQATPPEPPPLQLEIIIRADQLQVADKPGRILQSFPRVGDSYDYTGVQSLLKQIKGRFPDETTATLLLEPEVRYNDLIEVMDAVRLYEQERDGKTVQVELFPDLAMGDAPELGGK